MPHHQVLGETADGRPTRIVEPLDCQQHLMLLRLQPFRGRRLLTEMQKAADLVSEIAEDAVIGMGKGVGSSLHYYIVSRYLWDALSSGCEEDGRTALAFPVSCLWVGL